MIQVRKGILLFLAKPCYGWLKNVNSLHVVWLRSNDFRVDIGRLGGTRKNDPCGQGMNRIQGKRDSRKRRSRGCLKIVFETRDSLRGLKDFIQLLVLSLMNAWIEWPFRSLTVPKGPKRTSSVTYKKELIFSLRSFFWLSFSCFLNVSLIFSLKRL